MNLLELHKANIILNIYANIISVNVNFEILNIMEETVGTSHEYSYKSQPLRILFKGQEYQFHALQKSLRKEDQQIKILLDGFVQVLSLREGKWYFAGSE